MCCSISIYRGIERITAGVVPYFHYARIHRLVVNYFDYFYFSTLSTKKDNEHISTTYSQKSDRSQKCYAQFVTIKGLKGTCMDMLWPVFLLQCCIARFKRRKKEIIDSIV